MKAQEREALLRALRRRFEQNMQRHPQITWAAVQARLDAHPDVLRSLREMEATGGEPDVIQQYRELQTLGEFDTKTSSWVAAPADVRTLGGALFCDRRYGRVFVYHNAAQSYYAGRGFRGWLRV